ncbi:GSCOCG00000801001-RA-CDS [Cotesia congregata]|uniref:Uncharacterized protein n=1 Tax=Cotesia congregata TaxID=51543 RepID=A0A8J2HGI6_COTCN|nr:uncharacterized protein LOC123273135 isoform X2 [Cotesia glomerata]CAD6222191.1 GSCOCG00000801001-RA-CDS [Cotesia congregata]CAG5095519.1 Protein of unknown function [Cotesia congregata]
METDYVDEAQRRLENILRRARHLRLPTREILTTRPAKKLLTRTKNAHAWVVFLGTFLILLSGLIYLRWTTPDGDTIRTVIRKPCGPKVSGKFSERVAALLYTSSTQDDC